MKASCAEPIDTAPVPAHAPLAEERDAPRMTLPDGQHQLVMGQAQLTVRHGRPTLLTAHAGNFDNSVREAERVCGLWFNNFAEDGWPKLGEKGYDTPRSQTLHLFATDWLEIQPTHRVWSRTASGTEVRFLVRLDGARAVTKADSLDEDPTPMFTRSAEGVWTPNPEHDYVFGGMVVTRVEVLGAVPKMGGGGLRKDLRGSAG